MTLSFQSLEFWCYRFQHWNCGPILINIVLLTLSFLTLDFWPFVIYFGRLFLSFRTLEFLPIFMNIVFRHMFLDFWRYTTHSRDFTFVCCIDGIQHFLEFRLFIKKYNVWSQSSGVQGRAINLSSYAKYLVKVVCKSIEKLSFLLY